MSSISCVYHRSGIVHVNWSRPTDSGSTENARVRVENRKLFKILFKLLYLRFPPLQIRTCVFRTCIFHPCIFVFTYSVLAYSIPRYCRFPYLRFQSPRIKNFLHSIKRGELINLIVEKLHFIVTCLFFPPPKITRDTAFQSRLGFWCTL